METFRFNVWAVVVGLIALPILYAVLNLISHGAVDNPAESPAAWSLLAPLSAVVLWLAPGFATGYIAKRSPLKHGVALGVSVLVAAPVGLALARLVGFQALGLPFFLLAGFLVPIAVGSVVGAFIGSYVANRGSAP
jgi:hypothetical protein